MADETNPFLSSAAADDRSRAATAFLVTAGNLKRVPRTGWVRAGVPAPESVADHSWRVALMGLLVGRTAGEASHLAALALVHDLAEAVVGDIAPGDARYGTLAKRDAEASAMAALLGALGAGGWADAAERLGELHAEYEAQESAAARTVKELDRLEMAVQALEYGAGRGATRGLARFLDAVEGKLARPELAAVLAAVRARFAAGEGVASAAPGAPRRAPYGFWAGAGAGAGAAVVLAAGVALALRWGGPLLARARK